MTLALVSLPKARFAPSAAEVLRELFAAAPHADGGWADVVAQLRKAVSGAWAGIVAERGGARWTVTETGLADADARLVSQPLAVVSGTNLEIRVCGDWSLEERATVERLLRAVAPAAVAAVQAELGIRTAALRMVVDLLARTGLRPVVCTPDGRVADGVASSELPAAGPLTVVGGRLSAKSRRDEEVLRTGLAEAASRRCRAVVALGADGAMPVVLDILPPLERNGACFQQQLVVLPRSRAGHGAERQPVVQQLFGLTPSEAVVALGIAEGVSIGDLAEQRGVAASTIRTQLKTILAKVGVRRQVELAHRLKVVC